MTTFVDALGLASDDTDWMDSGLCNGGDAERWHSYVDDDVAYAKRICRSCPVVTSCRQWGLDHDEASGIWGGLTERDRQNLHKQQAKQKELGL
jgi:WhiB family redox-sensing transcriptional regulator